MPIFGRKKAELEPVCKICNMEFADTERMYRHMMKAHSKPCKSK